ncbi:hypothetical protein Tco_0227135 [Tanacetum coccineum]
MTIDALVCGSTIGGSSGSGWEVDGNLALNRIIAALYPNGRVGLAGSGGEYDVSGDDTGSGGDGICGSSDEYDVSGDDGEVDMESSLSTSASDENGIGV